MYPASVEYPNRQRIIPNWRGGLWEQRYIYIFPFFSYCECVCVWFCVWFCPCSFAFTICPRVLSVHFFFYLKIFIFYFNNFILLYFILFYLFLSFFLFLSLLFWAVWRTGSWCSSQGSSQWSSQCSSGLFHWGGRAKFRGLVHKRPPSST